MYEQSLATPEAEIVLSGTCGICLNEARFTAKTRGGEAVSGGRVPNWRDQLACDCELQLINRERALLHYLLATQSIQPWMRVLALGVLPRLHAPLADLAAHLTFRQDSLESAPRTFNSPKEKRQSYHLIISSEQLDASTARSAVVQGLAQMLSVGGRLVFTAAFDPTAQTPADERGPLAWSILEILSNAGLVNAKASTFWSEEFGYLGPTNFIFSADR